MPPVPVVDPIELLLPLPIEPSRRPGGRLNVAGAPPLVAAAAAAEVSARPEEVVPVLLLELLLLPVALEPEPMPPFPAPEATNLCSGGVTRASDTQHEITVVN